MRPRAWDTPVLHADLDAFYASVEVLREPSLAGKPVIVGGTSNRGVVTSASYEARSFGVRSGMPTSRARRLCPEAVFVAPRFDSYMEYSRQVKEIFGSFSPTVEPLSLDEAYLDIHRAGRLWRDPMELGEALRTRVRSETGLAVSVGVAPNKLIAKLASRQAKPDGLLSVAPSEVLGFLHPLPVEQLWGVGEKTAEVLRRMGLRCIGDVARIPAQTLELALSPWGAELARLAQGRDSRPVVAHASPKSVGAEQTFEQDLTDQPQILASLLKLSDRVTSRLRSQGISALTVTIKVRFSSFETITRSRTLPCEVDSAAGVYASAREMLAKVLGASPRIRVRLLGVSVSNLKPWPASEQLTFWAKPRWGGAGRAMDGVRARFGRDALGFATLLDGSLDLSGAEAREASSSPGR